MSHTSPFYRTLARIAVPAVGAVAEFTDRRHAHRAHIDAPRAIEAWSRQHRHEHGPLAWFHAPSVGEGLQARAVMRALRLIRPGLRMIYTHYSPSAARFANTVDAEWHGYLGYDRRTDVDRMLAAARPDLLVLAKLDVWPELVARAAERGVPVALIAGTVSPRSRRLDWPSLGLTRPGYASLDLAAVVDDSSATLLQRLGTDPADIVVTGDPRIDSVLDAVDEAAAVPDINPQRSDNTLVAGSTWPADEDVVLRAMQAVLRTHPAAPLLIAPHEPTPRHLARLDRRARELGLPAPQRLSTLSAGADAPIVAVDTTGVLAQLYRRGAFAYVGGGFGGRGIHSVFEPAAWSKSVVIGPEDRGSADAELLARAGALTRLPRRDPVDALATIWRDRIDRPIDAQAAGRAARAALDTRRGAAGRTAALLAPLIN